MAMNKRGVFFTIMALLLVSFLFTSQKVSTNPYSRSDTDNVAARTRITVLDSYIDTFDSQAENSLATAGYFTLQNLSARVRTTGKYISDINASVKLCLNNKTTQLNCMNASQTINGTLSQLVDLARTNLSINSSFTIEQIWVSEEQPFEVVFWMNISYNISDPFASWEIHNQTIRADVDVTGIVDPSHAYALAYNNLTENRTFRQSTIRRFEFNNNTFYQYYTNKEYTANPGINTQGNYYFGPSVLQRYRGELLNGSACCGIETVFQTPGNIHASYFSNSNHTSWSYVDYLFLSRENINLYNCTRRQSGRFNATSFPNTIFRMDTHHIFNVYNVSNHVRYDCSST